MTTVTIKKEYETKELFDFVTDTYYLRNVTWISSVDFNEDYTKAIYTFEDEDVEKSFEVTDRHIAQAIAELIETGARHCNEDMTLDFEKWDSCISELILAQIALWAVPVK
jgi:hypothetical protein